MANFAERMRSAWNAFSSQEEEQAQALPASSYGGFFGVRPDRNRFRIGGERSIISSIYTRLAIDIASIEIRHTRHDNSDRYLEDVNSGLNECLTVEANLDQAASAFRMDIVLTMFDKGVAAVVPVDTTLDPTVTGGYDIKTMRVGDVVQWYPNHVRVNLYNERKGMRQEIVLEKRNVAIIENPLYSVMNEPNSTLQRLIRKLNLIDSVDEASSSGKLDLIIQLPYVIKTEAKRLQAEERRKEIEFQLKGSQYGIAYADGTEKITQLNRPAENNLLAQIEYLTNMLYSQLGLTPEVMNGTANEATMLNYNNRTIEPVIRAITEGMKRTFITKTARSQGQSIDSFRDPFKLTPLADLAASADIFARNEIMTSNEFRQVIGLKPSSDPNADKLMNSNMPQPNGGPPPASDGSTPPDGSSVLEDPNAASQPIGSTDASSFDNVDAAIHSVFAKFGAMPSSTVRLAPPSGLGSMDPDVELASLDEIDSSIDDAFDGLGLNDASA